MPLGAGLRRKPVTDIWGKVSEFTLRTKVPGLLAKNIESDIHGTVIQVDDKYRMVVACIRAGRTAHLGFQIIADNLNWPFPGVALAVGCMAGVRCIKICVGRPCL